MNNEPLPQIHLIRDTDLITFAYELHIFAGDFLRESEFNIHSLVTNTGTDSVAIMGKNHMWLSDALHAYCSTADLHQMIFTTEYIGARAFLFHTDRKEDGRLYGDVMMLDLDTLRQDVKRNTLSPYGVDIYRPNGRMETVSLEKMALYGALRKRRLEKLGVLLQAGAGHRMAAPLFRYVQPVEGAGVFLHGSGFGGTSERRLYGGGTESRYRHVPHTVGYGPADASL
ncbi:hypothetical protein [Intestinimonas timonensis]|uniref:hypothetical protein n=1 Tax=Intestinimonas timonensis TaxID=1689270 RepID=UPI001F5F728A|nr:hypothetical protein [Intestinimonas timonensis]